MNIKKLAELSKLTLSEKEEPYFENQFEKTIDIISKFNEVDTDNLEMTYIVTKTKNVVREDKITPERILAQDEALSGSKETHNGYFVVEKIIDKND